jgi:hypothetical protein
MFFPLLDDNITCSLLVRDHFLAFVLVFLSLWSVAQPLGRSYFLAKWCYMLLEGLQLGCGLMLLHDLVSVLHQSFLSE